MRLYMECYSMIDNILLIYEKISWHINCKSLLLTFTSMGVAVYAIK